MHEYSLALSVLDIAETYSKKANSNKIIEVEIEVGEVSGVVPEALEFALENLKNDSIITNAKIRIHIQKAQAKCLSCNKTFQTSQLYTDCPACHSYEIEFLSGKELRVKSILFDE